MIPQAWSNQGRINRSAVPNSTDESHCQTSNFDDLDREGCEFISVDHPSHAFGNYGKRTRQNAED